MIEGKIVEIMNVEDYEGEVVYVKMVNVNVKVKWRILDQEVVNVILNRSMFDALLRQCLVFYQMNMNIIVYYCTKQCLFFYLTKIMFR